MKRRSDRVLDGWLWFAALLALALFMAFFIMLGTESRASVLRFGWRFVVTSVWDPVHSVFGALPFLYGTAVTSLFALVFGGLVGVCTAVFLVYFVRGWFRSWLGGAIELLAAIPSVVYGLWGLFVLAPWLQHTLEPWLGRWLGFLPLFQGVPYGVGYLAAGLILSVMILPTVTALSRDVLLAVPRDIHEGALALGATTQEMITHVALPYARSGIISALMLGLGRAVGETIAVTMVIGNRPEISASLFAPGYTMASVIANEFTEATTHVYLSALYEVGLLLFLLTVAFYVVARLFIRGIAKTEGNV
ncbi:phosphate transport system permease protein [Alicyclobacillus cellulosilyticus]|uniref:Phosphate transport system permease protein n=1 Tax=Alicyclobacillus cellulosilyticus TaxID=1003997 RepID=A0A917K9V8_9BACL|nr:phosphate ABC transporter permease subunit PstC [Alicyclobacillus cellulosilyticus]GGJ04085.1 phosphate transport system permease protein [Alicyclobacillus cellulosilyticus]